MSLRPLIVYSLLEFASAQNKKCKKVFSETSDIVNCAASILEALGEQLIDLRKAKDLGKNIGSIQFGPSVHSACLPSLRQEAITHSDTLIVCMHRSRLLGPQCKAINRQR